MKRGRPSTGIKIKHSQTIFLVLKELRQNGDGWTNLTLLETHTKLHHQQISRALSILSPFIEIIDANEVFPTKIRLKMLRLKDTNMTFDRVLQYGKLEKMLSE